MSKHTPGPWKVWGFHDGFYKVIQAQERIDPEREGVDPNFDETVEEDLANARLIESAPDMFKVISEIFEDDKCGGECSKIPHGILMDLRAAYHRAKGE